MFWAIAGLVLTLAGTGIAAYGAYQEGQQESDAARLEAQKLRESQGVLEQQKTAQIAGKEAIGKVAEIRQRELSVQALETAQAGRAAKGQVAAAAGVGNLGGASPLRQSLQIQRQVERQLGVISGRQAELGIQTGVQTLAAEAQIAGTQYDIRWAGLGAEQREKEADWAEQYGLLSAIGTGLGGIGQGISGWKV